MAEARETMFQFKAWGVVLVILAVLGFFFCTGMLLESRVTKLESSHSYMSASVQDFKDFVKGEIAEMKGMLKDIRNDQIRRERREAR